MCDPVDLLYEKCAASPRFAADRIIDLEREVERLEAELAERVNDIKVLVAPVDVGGGSLPRPIPAEVDALLRENKRLRAEAERLRGGALELVEKWSQRVYDYSDHRVIEVIDKCASELSILIAIAKLEGGR